MSWFGCPCTINEKKQGQKHNYDNNNMWYVSLSNIHERRVIIGSHAAYVKINRCKSFTEIIHKLLPMWHAHPRSSTRCNSSIAASSHGNKVRMCVYVGGRSYCSSGWKKCEKRTITIVYSAGRLRESVAWKGGDAATYEMISDLSMTIINGKIWNVESE